MSPTQEPSIKTIPTIKEAFGIYPELMDAIKQNYIHSVTAVMLLPKEVLAKMEHFNAKKAQLVGESLADHELVQLQGNQNVRYFVESQFGCIEDAPVGVLDVVTVPTMRTSMQVHSPLILLAYLEEYEPNMTVLDLIHMSEHSLRKLVRGRVELGPVVERIVDDIIEVNRRLSWWDEGLHIPLDARRRQHLRVVNG